MTPQFPLPGWGATEEAITRVEVAAKMEIHLMAERAREELDRGFAFINRSIGQRRRWARLKHNTRQQGDSQ